LASVQEFHCAGPTRDPKPRFLEDEAEAAGDLGLFNDTGRRPFVPRVDYVIVTQDWSQSVADKESYSPCMVCPEVQTELKFQNRGNDEIYSDYSSLLHFIVLSGRSKSALSLIISISVFPHTLFSLRLLPLSTIFRSYVVCTCLIILHIYFFIIHCCFDLHHEAFYFQSDALTLFSTSEFFCMFFAIHFLPSPGYLDSCQTLDTLDFNTRSS